MDLSRVVWRKSNRSGAELNCVEVAAVPAWRKSSRSGEDFNCVEVAAVPTWRKSSRTFENSNCVEVAAVSFPLLVAVRDSKDRSGPVLAFNASEWNVFAAAVQAGAHDLP